MPLQFYSIVYCNPERLFFVTNKEQETIKELVTLYLYLLSLFIMKEADIIVIHL